MIDQLKAGLWYFAVVFGAGFLMGPLREFLLRPYFGSTGAVLAESPVLLLAMVLGAWWIVRRYDLNRTLPARLTMGGVGLTFVLVGDVLVGFYLRGWPPGRIVRYYGSPSGIITLVLFVIYFGVPAGLMLVDETGDA